MTGCVWHNFMNLKTSNKMRYKILSLLVLPLLSGGVAISAQQTSSDLPLGIVAEKPEQGPHVETEFGFMVPYKTTIPGTDVQFEMIPVPAGSFKMGSPEAEPDRREDEGPQIQVELSPFWIGKFEVTWAEYKRYMALHDAFKAFESRGIRKVTEENKIDVITAPSSLYEPSFTYDAGEDPRQPAATITQYAAKQYTKWLSILSGDFYRLPSEAEWEYACRAGTTTAYSFGDDPEMLDEYAWFDDNSDYQRHPVGEKKPNPWGLYDMHGNVAEWVLDQYDEAGYQHIESGKSQNAKSVINWPTTPDPRVVRGGSWELFADDCRSAARLGSNDSEWKDKDPNIPRSPWWLTTPPATGVGFRLVRPLAAPKTRDEKEKFWRADVKKDIDAIRFRIDSEGRGAEGIVDTELLKAVKELKKK